VLERRDISEGERLEVKSAQLLGVKNDPTIGRYEYAIADRVRAHDLGFISPHDGGTDDLTRFEMRRCLLEKLVCLAHSDPLLVEPEGPKSTYSPMGGKASPSIEPVVETLAEAARSTIGGSAQEKSMVCTSAR
jgi:hypothetical protein